MATIYPFLHGFLSQWHTSYFTLENIDYICAEQYMMHKKALLFSDEVMAEKIIKATRPSDHKRLGQQVRNFCPSTWGQHKVQIVTDGNRAKFSQNSGLKKKLLATGNAILAEANQKDIIWGVGLAETDPDVFDQNKWRGQNLLGNILMGIREKLLSET